jgi:hypothetical protein
MRRARAPWLPILASVAAFCGAAEPSRPEYEVKAIFLLRIAQFTEWPARGGAPARSFRLCIRGEDPFGTLIDETLRGERIDGRPAEVRRLAAGDSAASCDLLFLSRSARDDLGDILAGIAGRPVLTVADFDGFVGAGGSVELYLEEGFVRFRIDRRAAEAAGLQLRSQLLKAASAVRDG